MPWFSDGWSGPGARFGMGRVDRAEEAGLYVRSLDDFLIPAQVANRPWNDGLSPELEHSPELRNQDGDMERLLVETTSDLFIDEVDVIVQLPGGESPQAVVFGDAMEALFGPEPSHTFGGGASPDWMLTLLPSDDWIGFPGPVTDPWG